MEKITETKGNYLVCELKGMKIIYKKRVTKEDPSIKWYNLVAYKNLDKEKFKRMLKHTKEKYIKDFAYDTFDQWIKRLSDTEIFYLLKKGFKFTEKKELTDREKAICYYSELEENL